MAFAPISRMTSERQLGQPRCQIGHSCQHNSRAVFKLLEYDTTPVIPMHKFGK